MSARYRWRLARLVLVLMLTVYVCYVYAASVTRTGPVPWQSGDAVLLIGPVMLLIGQLVVPPWAARDGG